MAPSQPTDQVLYVNLHALLLAVMSRDDVIDGRPPYWRYFFVLMEIMLENCHQLLVVKSNMQKHLSVKLRTRFKMVYSLMNGDLLFYVTLKNYGFNCAILMNHELSRMAVKPYEETDIS
jgi:hypothetical protein